MSCLERALMSCLGFGVGLEMIDALQGYPQYYHHPSIRYTTKTIPTFIVCNRYYFVRLAIATTAIIGTQFAIEPFSIEVTGSTRASANWSTALVVIIRFVLSAKTAACLR